MNIVNVGYRSTNYYALEIRGGKLLVDCGWPGTLAQFTATLRRKDIEPSSIKYILITHFHPDHAGLAEEFKAFGSKLILLESQTAAVVVPTPQRAAKISPRILVSPAANVALKFEDSRSFLAALGLAGEIIPTPGHSPDSITLILDNGFAFTGDLPPRAVVPETDLVTRESWDRIDRHNVSQILPAHGS